MKTIISNSSMQYIYVTLSAMQEFLEHNKSKVFAEMRSMFKTANMKEILTTLRYRVNSEWAQSYEHRSEFEWVQNVLVCITIFNLLVLLGILLEKELLSLRSFMLFRSALLTNIWLFRQDESPIMLTFLIIVTSFSFELIRCYQVPHRRRYWSVQSECKFAQKRRNGNHSGKYSDPFQKTCYLEE